MKPELVVPRSRRLSALERCGLLYLAIAVRSVATEIGILVRHVSGKRKARKYRGRRGLKINFACGPNRKEGWVNVDRRRDADLKLDLRKSLPFDTASCALTVSEHFLEHLDFPNEALRFLCECFRITEPGGRISIGIPDAGAVMVQYAEARAGGFARPVERDRSDPPWVLTWIGRVNMASRLNLHSYVDQHRYAWDFNTLELVLKEVGFVDIAERAPDPELDSPSRIGSTLYVTARRP